jgi:acyl-CoA thioesterase I
MCLFIYRSITVFFVLLFSAGLLGTSAAADDRPVLLVLGDSLSAAYGIELNESWVALLQGRLQKHNAPYRVINASVSGDTSRTALTRLQKKHTQYQPELCLVELGGNDGLQGLPASELKANLSEIISLCRQTARHVLLFEILIPMNYGPVYRDRLMAVYQELGSREGVSLVPFFMQDVVGKSGMMQADGIHPSVQAQPLLLDNVWPSVEPFL